MSPLVPLNTNIYLQEAKGLALALHIKGVQFEDATRDRRLRPFLSFPRLRFMQSRNSLPSLSPSRAGMHALRSRNGSLDPPPPHPPLTADLKLTVFFPGLGNIFLLRARLQVRCQTLIFDYKW